MSEPEGGEIRMNKDDFKVLGKEFKAMIKDIFGSGEAQEIGRNVGNTVNSALDTAFEEVRKAIESIEMEIRRSPGMRKTHTQDIRRPPVKQQPQKLDVNFPYKYVGKVSGILYTVFGGIGIGSAGIALIVFAALNILFRGLLLLPSVVLSVIFGASVIMLANGSVTRNRLKRFEKYLELISGRSTCMIDDLSANSGFNRKYITRDLKKMISLGMLPEAHIDEKNSYIMLNRESYELYLEHQAKLKKQELEEQQKAAERKQAARTSKDKQSAEPAVSNTIEEAKKNIHLIREARLAIPDKDVSVKVQKLEELISVIIDYVEQHPEKLRQVRRLLSYYLPTTVKLLNAFREFDRQPVQGENIIKAKQEIKDALDTVNHAFENLLDSLFETAAMDVSTDISVLRTMLEQDGLVEDDYKN
jgi:5-bromo-4-chloroindolyl phosphate hydrolysis protein